MLKAFAQKGGFSVRRRFLVNVTEQGEVLIYEVKCYEPWPKKDEFSLRVRFLVNVTKQGEVDRGWTVGTGQRYSGHNTKGSLGT